jgi:hypothetical protein
VFTCGEAVSPRGGLVAVSPALPLCGCGGDLSSCIQFPIVATAAHAPDEALATDQLPPAPLAAPLAHYACLHACTQHVPLPLCAVAGFPVDHCEHAIVCVMTVADMCELCRGPATASRTCFPLLFWHSFLATFFKCSLKHFR